VFLNKNKTVDNFQKHNTCINAPSHHHKLLDPVLTFYFEGKEGKVGEGMTIEWTNKRDRKGIQEKGGKAMKV
jgi:hypothetical protein